MLDEREFEWWITGPGWWVIVFFASVLLVLVVIMIAAGIEQFRAYLKLQRRQSSHMRRR